jgi:hypothetical protein
MRRRSIDYKLRKMKGPCRAAVAGLMLLAIPAFSQKVAPMPLFESYSVATVFNGTPAAPILVTPEQRRYQTRIRNGVLKGEDVVADSESNRRLTKPETNFAGKYVVIIWGCGSQCGMMAVVDAETGNVYDPPLSGTGSELFVPLDNLSDMHIGFRRDSSLMILRNACQDFRNRKSCGTYYFNWKDNRWVLVKFVMVEHSETTR